MAQSLPKIPLVVEFSPGTRIRREEPVESPLPILRNGPPGTFILFPNGRSVPIPTDQVVLDEDRHGSARIGFGGMTFEGLEENGNLVFWRVRDILPEELLAHDRGDKMTLEPQMVASILVDGTRVWPRPAELAASQ